VMLDQDSVRPIPTGEMIPSPVTTTLRVLGRGMF
jgi:hypothetical protein